MAWLRRELHRGGQRGQLEKGNTKVFGPGLIKVLKGTLMITTVFLYLDWSKSASLQAATETLRKLSPAKRDEVW